MSAIRVVSETEERTTRSTGGTLYGLAAPSQGGAELSSWRVEMAAGQQGPVHAIDREQVWMPLSGSFEVTAGDETVRASAGQALVLPAGVVRQVSAVEGPARALVCMAAEGRASVPGGEKDIPLPWAS